MKTCVNCKQTLSLDLFSFKDRVKGKYQSRCKACYSEYNKAYYKAGERVKQLERVKSNNKRIRDQFSEWKRQQRCCVCGEDSPECLDFHHLDPTQKEGVLARPADFGSWERVMEEVDKCAVVCANCHRKMHSGRITLPR